MDSLTTVRAQFDFPQDVIDGIVDFQENTSQTTDKSSSYVSKRENSPVRNKENVGGGGASSRPTTTKTIAAGATKKMQNFKTTFDSLSQKLRRSTRRRYRLHPAGQSQAPLLDSPSPVKMYSPFCIDTPSKCTRSISNLGTPGKYTPRRAFNFDSPSQCFRQDVEALTKGTRQLNTMANGIALRSSFRK